MTPPTSLFQQLLAVVTIYRRNPLKGRRAYVGWWLWRFKLTVSWFHCFCVDNMVEYNMAYLMVDQKERKRVRNREKEKGKEQDRDMTSLQSKTLVT